MTTTQTDATIGTTTTSGGTSRESSGTARSRASDAYYAARERTSSALSSTSQRLGQTSERASETIDANPIAALIGGLALGGLLAAILPKTEREEEMFGDYGRRINEKAREAARAAREAGVGKLDELGYNKENVRSKIETLRSDAADIAAAAAQRIKGDATQVATAVAQDTKDAVRQ